MSVADTIRVNGSLDGATRGRGLAGAGTGLAGSLTGKIGLFAGRSDGLMDEEGDSVIALGIDSDSERHTAAAASVGTDGADRTDAAGPEIPLVAAAIQDCGIDGLRGFGGFRDQRSDGLDFDRIETLVEEHGLEEADERVDGVRGSVPSVEQGVQAEQAGVRKR